MQINDVVIVMLFFFSSLHGMYDNGIPDNPIKYPSELRCPRILEKIEWVLSQMEYELNNSEHDANNHAHFQSRMNSLESRLERLQAKLGVHEND